MAYLKLHEEAITAKHHTRNLRPSPFTPHSLLRRGGDFKSIQGSNMVNQHYQEKEADTIDEATLLKLADDMAAAATTFSAHGYDHFVLARENFKKVSKQIFDSHIKKAIE